MHERRQHDWCLFQKNSALIFMLFFESRQALIGCDVNIVCPLVSGHSWTISTLALPQSFNELPKPSFNLWCLNRPKLALCESLMHCDIWNIMYDIVDSAILKKPLFLHNKKLVTWIYLKPFMAFNKLTIRDIEIPAFNSLLLKIRND
jgi:hypothetical protein